MQTTNISHAFHSVTHCPKCTGVLEQPTFEKMDGSDERTLVYKCRKCAMSFALLPVTEYRLFETNEVSRDWKVASAN